MVKNQWAIMSISRSNFFQMYSKIGGIKFYVELALLNLSLLTNFRLFQTEDFADDNFIFDENGKMFSKWVANTVEKREIACYKQFLLFPLCFQKTCTADT